jgi:hypothetical protein
MRLSRVLVLSLYQHDLVDDPGGFRLVLPMTTRRILRSSALKLSALPTPMAQAFWGGYPLRVHNFQTTFAAQYRPC